MNLPPKLPKKAGYSIKKAVIGSFHLANGLLEVKFKGNQCELKSFIFAPRQKNSSFHIF